MTLDRPELLSVLKGEKPDADLRYFTPEGHESDMGYEVLRRAETLGIRLEVREVEGRYELFAPTGKLPEDLKARCREFRDPIIRAVWMKTALDYLRRRGVDYVPLDVSDDLETSYEDDTLEEFRDVVRAWIRELAKAGAA